MGEQGSFDLLSLFGWQKTEGMTPPEDTSIKGILAQSYVDKVKWTPMIKEGKMLKKYLLGTGWLSDLFMDIAIGFMKPEQKEEIKTLKANLNTKSEAELQAFKDSQNVEAMASADLAALKATVTQPETQTTTPPAEASPEATYLGKFEEINISNPATKILKMASPEFDPTTGQVNIFYCGFGVTIEEQKKIFEENKVQKNQATIIVEWDPSHISRENVPEKRYDDIKANAETFKKNIETQVFGGKEMKKICLIGHSGAGTVVNDLTGKLMETTGLELKTIIIDGTYGDAQTSNVKKLSEAMGKIYYVPNTETAQYKTERGIAMDGKDHFSIIPAALQKEGILIT